MVMKLRYEIEKGEKGAITDPFDKWAETKAELCGRMGK